MQKRRLIYLAVPFSLAVILSGCFKGEQSMEEVDPPQNSQAVDKQDNGAASNESTDDTKKDTDSEVVEDTVARQLYLIDVNGMVVPQTLEIPVPESKEVAKQAVEYLVKDGPVSSILPNGFQAVLPSGTEVLGVELQEDGTIIVDVSDEFKEYEAEDEVKILEAMTHTLTQFEKVERMKLRINGKPLEEMPVNGTPIAGGYSKANGINVTEADTVDFLNNKTVTMYFPMEHNDTRYYVPITKYVDSSEEDVFQAIVNTLIDGPGYDTNVIHVFNTETELVEKPVLEDGILRLKFNEKVLKDSDKSIISDEVMETLVRTLTEQEQVESVDIKVENVDKLVNENGEVYDEPVTKKAFVPKEKL